MRPRPKWRLRVSGGVKDTKTAFGEWGFLALLRVNRDDSEPEPLECGGKLGEPA